MQLADRNTIAIRPRDSEGFISAGHSARPSRNTQNSRPTNNSNCQTRPMLVNSRPWLPSQKLKSKPRCCSVPSQPVRVEPTTTTMSAQNSTSTPSFCSLGSRPDSSGATYNPVASHAVAIQKMPTCVCTVRLTTYGSTCASGMPKNDWPSTA